MTFLMWRDEADQLRVEYEGGIIAGFQPEEELLFPFREIGFTRITMQQAKELLLEINLKPKRRVFEVNVNLNPYGN